MDNFPWDNYSDQPKILPRSLKKELRKGHLKEYLKLFAINLPLYPYFAIKSFITPAKVTVKKDIKDFLGICVNLDKGSKQIELVEELGVKLLQIRIFLKDINNLQKYVEFAKSFKNKEILITVIPEREHIKNLTLLESSIKKVFQEFQNITSEFQIGNAVNRIKWGFVTIDEYLKAFEAVKNLRDNEFKDIKLIGSSIIDFEYHFTIRSLFNNYNIYFDKFSSLLYVDRRGSPYNKQMLLFDLEQKIKFLHTIVSSSKKSANSIYITEANWPISNTSPYAPTSEKECVSEEEYIKFMKEYIEIALNSKRVEKLFWHQLIAPGYGLIDNRDGKIRKRDAFFEFKRLINDG